ncbi:MAG: DUF6293 family protein [Nitrososphaeraceae archaeon]
MNKDPTLQIATFGQDMQEGIASGIRNFPVHKLALICFNDDAKSADDFSRKIRNVLGIPVKIYLVNENNVIRDTMERVTEIATIESRNFSQVLINVSCGDKLLGCAALSAAFINGIKAFGIDVSGSPLLMPVLKLSYSEIVSEAKISILRSIDQVGIIESLDQLEQLSGYGKPLLSYHIQGTKESKGLVDLGLLDVEKGNRGKLSAKLTTLGKLLVSSNTLTTSEPLT